MSSALASESPLRRQFDDLAKKWETDTRFLSSVEQISMHPSYQRIIGLGPAVLPLILARMSQDPGHWFWALAAITGDDAVRPEHVGDLAAMTEDWLLWARERKEFVN